MRGGGEENEKKHFFVEIVKIFNFEFSFSSNSNSRLVVVVMVCVVDRSVSSGVCVDEVIEKIIIYSNHSFFYCYICSSSV